MFCCNYKGCSKIETKVRKKERMKKTKKDRKKERKRIKALKFSGVIHTLEIC
jgi:hypothetical protein